MLSKIINRQKMLSSTSNLFKYPGTINRANREKLLGQHGLVIWFSGLSGSGKSTLAHKVEEVLHSKDFLTQVLDGDNIRLGLCNDLGFSLQDRKENIRRISEVCKLATNTGVITLTAFISPMSEYRQIARKIIGENNFIEIYCKCSLETCESRDNKGVYKKARAGLIQNFTGITSPYEEPNNAELVLDTEFSSLSECTNHVIEYLLQQKLINFS